MLNENLRIVIVGRNILHYAMVLFAVLLDLLLDVTCLDLMFALTRGKLVQVMLRFQQINIVVLLAGKKICADEEILIDIFSQDAEN